MGIREWWADPATSDGPAAKPIKWSDILAHWLDVTVDLHEMFGVDTDSDILDNRHWFWLKDRIIALIDKPTRLRAALNIPADATTS